MPRHITVEFHSSSKDESPIVDTKTRPLRELPAGNGYGVVWRKKVYPLHEFDGVRAHTHLEGLTLFDPSECPVVLDEVYLDKSSSISIRGAIDLTGYYKYLLIDGFEDQVVEVVSALESDGTSDGKYGPASKAARNGRLYDFFVRIDPRELSGQETGNMIVNTLNSVGFELVLDDVWEAGHVVELGEQTSAVSQSSPATRTTPSNAGSSGTLKVLERNTESLLRGFEAAGWGREQIAVLRERLGEHAVDQLASLDPSAELELSDEFIRTVIDERASIIGTWARTQADRMVSDFKSEINRLRESNSQMAGKLESVQIKEPTGDSQENDSANISVEDRNLRVRISRLVADIDSRNRDYDELLHDYQRLEDVRDDIEQDRQRAHQKISRLEEMSRNWSESSDLVADFRAAYIPNVELVRDSEARLASREFSDRSQLLAYLLKLNDGEPLPGTHRLEGAAKEWDTTHFSTGTANDGRLYFRHDGRRMRVLISPKRNQNHDTTKVLPGL